jgi:hypothetical protein
VSGATVMSDQFPSQTVVSLYFTPTGSQGVGFITGSATAATVVSTTSSGGAGAKTTSGTTSKASAASGGESSSQSSSTSSGGAAPTGVWSRIVGAVLEVLLLLYCMQRRFERGRS